MVIIIDGANLGATHMKSANTGAYGGIQELVCGVMIFYNGRGGRAFVLSCLNYFLLKAVKVSCVKFGGGLGNAWKWMECCSQIYPRDGDLVSKLWPVACGLLASSL